MAGSSCECGAGPHPDRVTGGRNERKSRCCGGRSPGSILADARREAEQKGLRYAGDIDPAAAHALVAEGAVLVDVRTAEERRFVGRPDTGVHIPWRTGVNMELNPRFLEELEAKVPADATVLFLCRSGRRSVDAVIAAAQSGYIAAFNILEGFEGDLDENKRRSTFNGWRFRNLPWSQD